PPEISPLSLHDALPIWVLEIVQAKGFLRGSVNRWPELHELAMGNDELLSDPRSWPRFQPGDDLSGREGNSFFVRTRGGRYVDLPDRKSTRLNSSHDQTS